MMESEEKLCVWCWCRCRCRLRLEEHNVRGLVSEANVGGLARFWGVLVGGAAFAIFVVSE